MMHGCFWVARHELSNTSVYLKGVLDTVEGMKTFEAEQGSGR
jgi:hypothetical protein